MRRRTSKKKRNYTVSGLRCYDPANGILAQRGNLSDMAIPLNRKRIALS
jgi:hypothetical protein